MKRISDDLLKEILEMYISIQSAVSLLENSEINVKRAAFPGFDGNHPQENVLMRKVRKLLDKGEFSALILRNESVNSHSEMREYYHKCLERYKEKGKMFPLPESDIIYILNL